MPNHDGMFIVVKGIRLDLFIEGEHSHVDGYLHKKVMPKYHSNPCHD
jgi:hypothetical protein